MTLTELLDKGMDTGLTPDECVILNYLVNRNGEFQYNKGFIEGTRCEREQKWEDMPE